MSRLVLTSLLAIMAMVAVTATSAEARRYGNCYWNGTSPFCAGSCRSGFVVRGYQACFSGYKVKCCEPMGSTTQSQRR